MALPSAISTKWGQDKALHLVNAQIPGTLEAKNIRINWIGPQVFEGVTLKGVDGETIMSFDSFVTDTPLLNFFFSGPTIGKVDLKGLCLNIVEEYPQVTNLHQALGTKAIRFGMVTDKVMIQLPFATEIAVKRKNSPTDFRPQKAIVFEDVNMHLDVSNPFSPLELTFDGKTRQGDNVGHFAVQAKLSGVTSDKWVFDRKSIVSVKADVENFPVAMIDLLFPSEKANMHGFLFDALGETLSMHIDQTLSQDDGLFEVHTTSPTLQADVVANLVDGKFSLQQEGKVSFKITPALFDRFSSRSRNTPLLQLASPTQTTLTIERFSLPVNLEEGFDMEGLSFEAELDFEDANLTGSPFWGELTIKGVKSTMEASEGSSKAEWHFRGEANQNGQPLHIKLDAQVQKPTKFEALFETLRSRSKMQVQVAGIPLVKLETNEGGVTGEATGMSFSIVDDTFAVKFDEMKAMGKVEALFGPSFSGVIEGSFSGDIFVQLSSDQSSLFLNGSIDNGNLLLNDPIEGEFTVTPLFGREILGAFVPAFDQVVGAEDRVALFIDSKNFSLPLNLSKGTIESACLTLGKVNFQEKGEIAALLDLLEIDRDKNAKVWFTPINWCLKDGALLVNRVDMLFLDRYPLATWGKIDLAKQNVDMTLAISAEALKGAFGVEGISNDFMLPLALKGHIKKAKIDKRYAAACISALIAKDQVKDKNCLVGAALGIASYALTRDAKKIPSPTVSHFPWEKS
jgi:hypothetical protein